MARPEIEDELCQWIIQQRAARKRVSCKLALKKGQDMSTARGKTDKLSRGWLARFFRRKRLTKRRRTNVAQKAPADLLDKLVEFVSFVREKRKKHGYLERDQIAADETAVWLDLPGILFTIEYCPVTNSHFDRTCIAR